MEPPFACFRTVEERQSTQKETTQTLGENANSTQKGSEPLGKTRPLSTTLSFQVYKSILTFNMSHMFLIHYM